MSITRLLITPKDIANLKEFNLSTRPEKINNHILSAQRMDVMPLVKERLFNAIVKNPDNYEELLNEGYYTYEGQEYVNYGLKAIIALFAHARFTMFGSANYDTFGITEKNNNGVSTQVSTAYKKNLYEEAKQEALDAWGNVYLFLVRTKEPLFMDSCNSNSREQTSGDFSFNIITRDC